MRLFFSGLFLTISFAYLIFFLIVNDPDSGALERASIETIVSQVMKDLDRAMPVINKAGYEMSRISVKSSLPPVVVANFTLTKSITPKEQEVLLNSLNDNIIGKLAFQSLIHAFELDKMLKVKEKKLKVVRLFLTIPPAVQVDYE